MSKYVLKYTKCYMSSTSDNWAPSPYPYTAEIMADSDDDALQQAKKAFEKIQKEPNASFYDAVLIAQEREVAKL